MQGAKTERFERIITRRPGKQSGSPVEHRLFCARYYGTGCCVFGRNSAPVKNTPQPSSFGNGVKIQCR